MYSPLDFLKRQVLPTYLGVDIGTTSVKMVEVVQGKERPAVVNYGLLEASGYLAHSNKALQTSTLKLFEEEVVNLLQSLVREMKPETVDVLASLPLFGVFSTVLDFPEMTEKELRQAIDYQARQYIPLPLPQVAYDWMRVGEFQDDKGFKHIQVFLFSIPREQIRRYQSIFKKAGLRLNGLELESLSLGRILVGTDPTPTLVVDIGSRSTVTVFVDKGQMKFNSQSDFAGASLTQALAVSLNISPLRAEELKKERGISSREGANYELSTVMLPFLDAIISEVKKALFTYEHQFPAAPKPERIILSGGSANLIGIEKYFQAQFEIPVVKASPLSVFEYLSSLEPLVSELNPMLSVALGLTLQGFI